MRSILKTLGISMIGGFIAAALFLWLAGAFGELRPPILEPDPSTTEIEVTP